MPFCEEQPSRGEQRQYESSLKLFSEKFPIGGKIEYCGVSGYITEHTELCIFNGKKIIDGIPNFGLKMTYNAGGVLYTVEISPECVRALVKTVG